MRLPEERWSYITSANFYANKVNQNKIREVLVQSH